VSLANNRQERGHASFGACGVHHQPAIEEPRRLGQKALATIEVVSQQIFVSDDVDCSRKGHGSGDRGGGHGLTQIDKSDIYIWPFNTLPDLASWTSLPHRRTVLLGDAAHAIPPTGGQGACQAIEDAYTFAMVVSLASRTNLSPDAFARSIDTWQTARQQRIQRARMFTKQLDNNRLPIAERSTLPTGTYWMEGEHPDLSWLYGDGLANSAAKGVTRVEVRKEVGPGPLRIRAATVDSAYGFTRRGTTAVPT